MTQLLFFRARASEALFYTLPIPGQFCENIQELKYLSMKEFFAEKNLSPKEKSSESLRAENLLQKTEMVLIELEAANDARFDQGFTEKARSSMTTYWKALIEKGESTLDQLEAKGLPLPKSKLGIRLLSGATGLAGVAVPGLGFLIPLSYILWKRGGLISIEKQYAP